MAVAVSAASPAAAVLSGARLPAAGSSAPRSPALLLPSRRRSWLPGAASLHLPVTPVELGVELAGRMLGGSWAKPRNFLPSGIFVFLDDAYKFSALKVRATSSSKETSSSIETEELLSDLKQKWDSIENKSTVFIYGGGAFVAIWLSSILIGAINSVPLLPKLLELVGLGYTGWFVYRYLLFKSSRKELAEDIEALKKKVAGTE